MERAAGGKESGRRAVLDDAPLLHDQDAIGAADVGQAVRDRQHRAADAEGFDGVEHPTLGVRIQPGGRFIQQEHGGAFQKDPRQRHLLGLAAGKPDALLTHRGIQALGQPVREIQHSGRPGRLRDAILARIGLPQPEVLAQAPVEEHRVLPDPAHLPPPGSGIDVVQGGAVYEDLPLVRRDEAEQQGDKRRLAGPAASRQHNAAAGGERKADPFQRRPAPRVVGEMKVAALKADSFRRREPPPASGQTRQRPLQHSADLLGRCQRPGPGVVVDAQLAQRQVELRSQQQNEQAVDERDRLPI